MPEHIALEWPEWLMADAKAGLGDGMARELAALMTEAPTDVRINPLKQPDQRKLRDQLAGREIKGHPTRLSPFGVRLEKRTGLMICKNGKPGFLSSG
jgi:16S rRNA (cytosine967-C5)-methyltransferase